MDRQAGLAGRPHQPEVGAERWPVGVLMDAVVGVLVAAVVGVPVVSCGGRHNC